MQAFGVLHSVRKVKYLKQGVRRVAIEGKMRHVLVTYLLNIEETAFGADVGFTKVLQPVHDRCTHCSGYPVVVRLANTTNSRDISFEEEMLRVVCEAYEIRCVKYAQV